jgi:hypothetical protein
MASTLRSLLALHPAQAPARLRTAELKVSRIGHLGAAALATAKPSRLLLGCSACVFHYGQFAKNLARQIIVSHNIGSRAVI